MHLCAATSHGGVESSSVGNCQSEEGRRISGLENLHKAHITWPVTELVGLRGKKARESPGLKLPPNTAGKDDKNQSPAPERVMGEHKHKGTHMETKSPIYLPADLQTCHGVIKSLHADLDGMVQSANAAELQAQDSASQARLRELQLEEQIEYWKAKQRQAAPVIKSVYKD